MKEPFCYFLYYEKFILNSIHLNSWDSSTIHLGNFLALCNTCMAKNNY